MADITSLLPVLGANQRTLQPFEWHVWEINLAIAAFAGAGPDDAVLPDILPKDTRILAVKTQILTVATVATSLVLDVEIAKKTAAGVVTPISNLLGSVACQTGSTVEAASGSTTFDDIFADTDMIDSLGSGQIVTTRSSIQEILT
jgi:hypothetical protein